MEGTILSVSEVNNRIRELIELVPDFSHMYICGEISNYKRYPSGHHYFTLKDSDSCIKCVMFRSNADRLRFRPENGQQVLAAGKISVYPRDGVYQLYCNSLTPFGQGDLNLAFEQIRKKLEQEGLYEAEHKQKLPEYPGTVAVVTSSAGAAVHDVIRILGKRWPMTQVLVVPVKVQGEGAAEEIAAALDYVNRYKLADVIITGRGGGSLEDLWAFNEEVVARAIFRSRIPVISAVGHEPDVTISDYVADKRASTPSNGAELAVPDSAQVVMHLQQMCVRLMKASECQLSYAERRLKELEKSLKLHEPLREINESRMRLDQFAMRLDSAVEHTVEGRKNQLMCLASSLEAMSPLKVLLRGYTIAETEEGRVIRSARDRKTGDSMFVEFFDGKLECTVKGTNVS